MRIKILLPYKENFSLTMAGAVSIFVNDTTKLSKFKKNIQIYGSTKEKSLSNNYTNLSLDKTILSSKSKIYINKFLKKIFHDKIDLIEIHNRPHYFRYLKFNNNIKRVLFFHNDPIEMTGSETPNQRLNILENVDKIIFNSEWSKSRFLIDLDKNDYSDKLIVVPQSTSYSKINFKNKKKIISFVGKLNTSKGYDIFGKAIVKILNKHKDWSAIVIGDEPREKLFFNHKNLHILGFKSNKYILSKLKDVSISVVPSRWNEPFGRSSLESSSRGCALIISNKGGLKETTNNALILNKLDPKELYRKINFLITNPKQRLKIQKETHKNFKLTNKYSSKLLDNVRENLFAKKIYFNNFNTNNLKIMHITNFNERFDGRLHYNTGKRLNNGLVRLGHNVLALSDRDIVNRSKTIYDPYGIKKLNTIILDNQKNFRADLIILGHADGVSKETLEIVKKRYNTKICQWFLDPLNSKGPDYMKNKQRILDKSNIIETTFLTTFPKALNFNISNAYFIPNPSDKSFEILSNYKNECKYDLFYAISHGVHRGILKKGKIDSRESFIKNLIKKNVDIKFDVYGIDDVQPIWGQNFLNKLKNSSMALNLSRGNPIKYYSSDRITQLIGNGLLTFIDEKTQLSDLINNNEAVYYKNINDLSEKIHKFKHDEKLRNRIAENGKKKYLKEFNSEKVGKFIISKTFDTKTINNFFWDN